MNNNEIEKLDFTGWPLPDEYLVELGRVSTLWTSLDNLLMILIGKLAGFNVVDDYTPFILLNHASFPQKIDMLSTLCEDLVSNQPHLKSYKEVIGRLRSAQKLRNKFAHNSITLDEQSNKAQMITGSARGSLKLDVEAVTIADIKRASIEISDATKELYKLVLKKDHVAAWQQKAKS